MAATLFPTRGPSPTSHVNGLDRSFLNEYDIDGRYPTMNSGHLSPTSPHLRMATSSSAPQTDLSASPKQEPWSNTDMRNSPTRLEDDQRNSFYEEDQASSLRQQQQQPVREDTGSSFAQNSRRVEPQYSLDEESRGRDSRSVSTFVETRPNGQRRTSNGQLQPSFSSRGTPASPFPSSGPSPYNSSPISIPISPRYRAYAQQPAYATAPSPINPVTMSPQPPQEEVCVECAMRDQDMADVDVTTPGVWDRESDIHFHELLRLEHEEEMNGVVNTDPSRPRAKGGRLTEQNLKIWLSVNPREPASRQQTLEKYIRSQATLLEAEALAHARAMQEAKHLDNRMRDAYSQLRRSAYDTGGSITPMEDGSGVRIKPPNEVVHKRGPSREVTLLENGMIVEHVDVRKEEREARERKRREDRRARKSSRGSAMDVMSVYSTQSQSTPMLESPLPLPDMRFSPNMSGRPTSVVTAPMERPRIPRINSQASFSDVQSLGSLSPRRTRFFGFKNLSGGFRSQDSLAPSGYTGSMVDMHLALQREGGAHGGPAHDVNSPHRLSQVWPPAEHYPEDMVEVRSDEKSTQKKKKKKGLRKIWSIVTGSKTSSSQTPTRASQDAPVDDGPLAPPPSLSYLVSRTSPAEPSYNNARYSTISLHSTKNGVASPRLSPPTAPSSILPSPSSSRPDMDLELRKSPQIVEEPEQIDYTTFRRNEMDLRGRNINGGTLGPRQVSQPRPMSAISRDKSLPPLPHEAQQPQMRQHPVNQDMRPRTVFSYDPRQMPLGSSPSHDFIPPQAPFRTENMRRQSFGGIATRPNLEVQTVASVGAPDHKSFGLRYNEFGSSRRSLGRLDVGPFPHDDGTVSSRKRKSKFGLGSLFGKKTSPQTLAPENGLHQFPTTTRSRSSAEEEMMNLTIASSSRHSAAPRMSVMSRKVEELVSQDPDFVAYRYPSNDQELNLFSR